MIKKVLKIIGYILIAVVTLLLLIYLFLYIKWNKVSKENLSLLGQEAPTLSVDSITFRDLNKNGTLDIYEDKTAQLEDRVTDLLSQMTLEEKAGSMFITMIGMNTDGSISEQPSASNPFSLFLESNSTLLAKKKMNHFNIIQSTTAEGMATWYNRIQKLAERTRLGIPVTLATDPRHAATDNIGASIPTPFFSKWPSALGLAASRDTLLVQNFGDIARQEYLALGIRLSLSPMADLATEPRWGRSNGTFGEDAFWSAAFTKAYINGFQGDSLSSKSVATMTKHFSGGGPQKDGEDAHFPYGKDQAYPGDNFDYHLIPFTEGAFPAKTAQIMPYYGVPVGQTSEEVGFGYNKEIITGLLRETYGFEGVVCTDWGLVSGNFVKPAAAFGVEELSEIERVQKILDAGNDMFGGEANPQWIIDLVKSGKISEARLDESLRRILRDKSKLGLFDQPYVSMDGLSIIGNPDFIKAGEEAQRKSMVLLKNENQLLPLKKETLIYVEGLDKELAKSFGTLVNRPEKADVILLQLEEPFDKRNDYLLERFFRQGRLYYTDKEKETYLNIIRKKPTVSIINFSRPPVIPEVTAASSALIASFESDEKIIFELIYGHFNPSGKLPIEMPSSKEAVENQLEDVPYDSKDPLFPFGWGLNYSQK